MIATPTRRTAKARVLRLHDSATPEQVVDGVTWYPKAHNVGRRVAYRLGLPTVYGCGVVAALSPRNPWPNNIQQALALAEGETITGLSANIDKAMLIAAGHHPDNVLSGPKVIPFQDNCYRPTTSLAITADVWCSKTIFSPDTPAKLIEAWLKRKGSHAFIAEVYTAAAAERDRLGLVMQAINWGVIRGSAD